MNLLQDLDKEKNFLEVFSLAYTFLLFVTIFKFFFTSEIVHNSTEVSLSASANIVVIQSK
jgi:hypothetical protein